MANISHWIGSLGVLILLVAFFLNLFGFLNQHTKAYTLMNAIGAGLLCYTSWLIDFIPFVVLEATWMGVSLVGFINVMRNKMALPSGASDH